MKTIDLATWPRRSQYNLFRRFENPHLAITVRADVTRIMTERQASGISPFNAMLFCLLRAANAVPELCTRIEGETVVQHDSVNPSFTVPIEGDRFAFCEVDFVDDWPQFNQACKYAIERAKVQDELVEETLARSDWIFLSCLPWTDFTEIRQPMRGKDDCTPRIAWGRIVENDGRWSVSVNVTVHHALVDGAHIAAFFAAFDESLTKI